MTLVTDRLFGAFTVLAKILLAGMGVVSSRRLPRFPMLGWVGLGRIVYACSSEQLVAWPGDARHPGLVMGEHRRCRWGASRHAL